MITSLTEYFSLVVPPEKVVIYNDALSILRQIDPVMTAFNTDNILADIENNDSVGNVMTFESYLITNLSEEITKFGVYLRDDDIDLTALSDLTTMLVNLYRVDSYEAPGELLAILDEVSSTEEGLAEVLNTVSGGGVSVEAILELIAEVSPALIRRFRIELTETSGFQMDDIAITPDNTELKTRLIRYMEFHRNGRVKAYFEEGGTFGRPLDDYIDYFFDSAETPQSTAKTLYTCGVLAGISADKIVPELSERISGLYFDDSGKAIAAGRELNKLIGIEDRTP